MPPFRVVFFGTPALSVPFLELLSQQEHVVGVVTRPDQPRGRGYQSQPSPVKERAEALGLNVLEPTRFDASFLDLLRKLSPDLGVLVAYGRILPEGVLSIPQLGSVNIHFSLLPQYRGAAPIAWALIRGERETGATSFWMDAGMDSGPILLQKSMPIFPEDNALTLKSRLIPLGLAVLGETLEMLHKKGASPGEPQKGFVSLATPLRKEDGRLSWNKKAHDLVNLIRGLYEWPQAFGFLAFGSRASSLQLKILKAEALEGFEAKSFKDSPPGSVVGLVPSRGFVVKCLQGYVLLLEVHPAGKKPMSAWNFWQGARVFLGCQFLESPS